MRRGVVRLLFGLAFAALCAGCGVFGGDEEAATSIPDSTPTGSASNPDSDSDLDSGGSLEVTTPSDDEAAAETTSSLDDDSTTSSTAATTDSTETTTTTTSATTSVVETTEVSTTATSGGSSTTTSTAPTASTDSTAAPSSGECRSSATVCVGAGQQVTTLTDAVAGAGNGAVIELLSGTYNETVAVAADNVTIRSAPGGRSTIDCSGLRPAQGKACVLAVGTNLTVEDMVVTGARGPDNNEACFRNEPGTRFTVRNVECFGSNNGILGSGGSWLIEDSYFHGNGAGDGFSHNLYLSGDCSEVVFRRSTSERAQGGHAFKSRCLTSTIEGSTLRDNSVGDAAEFSYGGAVTIRDSVLYQPDGSNGNIVRHGAEGCRHSGSLRFVNATISSDRSQAYIRSSCAAVGLDSTQVPSGIEVSGP